MNEQKFKNNRRGIKSIRFEPDPNTLAWISLKKMGEPFTKDIMGLVVNESYNGCSVVLLNKSKIEVGSQVQISVGMLASVPAEVKWLKKLDHEVNRVGFQLLE